MADKRPHKAKPTTTKVDKPRRRSGGRNQKRYAKYRARKGRPSGPGQPGNKSGKNKIR